MNIHWVEPDHDETGVPPEYRVRLWTPPRDLLVDEPLASGPLASWFVDDYLVGSGESLRNILAWIDEQETRGVVRRQRELPPRQVPPLHMPERKTANLAPPQG